MREIKFRAWDAENGKMLEYQSHMSMYPFHMTPHGKVYKDGRLMPYELMQFTGLHDKDGKEIYEGDILDGHDDGNVEVVWRDGETQFDFADGGNIGVWEMPLRRSIVIGNIYENPELLEAE